MSVFNLILIIICTIALYTCGGLVAADLISLARRRRLYSPLVTCGFALLLPSFLCTLCGAAGYLPYRSHPLLFGGVTILMLAGFVLLSRAHARTRKRIELKKEEVWFLEAERASMLRDLLPPPRN